MHIKFSVGGRERVKSGGAKIRASHLIWFFSLAPIFVRPDCAGSSSIVRQRLLHRLILLLSLLTWNGQTSTESVTELSVITRSLAVLPWHTNITQKFINISRWSPRETQPKTTTVYLKVCLISKRNHHIWRSSSPELLSAFVSSMHTRPPSLWSAVTIDTSSQHPYKSSTANRLAGMAWAIGPRSSPLISRCNRLFLSIKTPSVSPSWRLSRLRRKLSFTCNANYLGKQQLITECSFSNSLTIHQV